MPDATFLFTITPLPLVSLMVWALLGFIALYLARRPFHQAIDALSRLIYYNMCLAASSIRTSLLRRESCFRKTHLTVDIEPAGRPAENASRVLFSAFAPFCISSLVLSVFVIGAMVNFSLIALPMAEMIGGNNYIAGFKSSDVASVFIVGLHIVLGIFLMDIVRVTRLVHVIGRFDRRQRIVLFLGLLFMLTILAGVESSLAFMRSHILSDIQTLRQSLAGIEPSSAAAGNIPVINQIILAFLLPFILCTAAIPVEAFIRSSQTMLGLVSLWALHLLTFLLRLTGSVGYYGGRVVVRLYDLIIFPGIWLENLILRRLEMAKGRITPVSNLPLRGQSPLNMMVKETVACKKTAD